MGKEKIPFAFTLNSEATFSLAGLYDVWKDAEDRSREAFTIITCEANELLTGLEGFTGSVVQHTGPLSQPEVRVRLAGFLKPTICETGGWRTTCRMGCAALRSDPGLNTTAVLQVSSAKQRGHRPRCLACTILNVRRGADICIAYGAGVPIAST